MSSRFATSAVMVAGLIGLSVGGCSEHFSRRDTLSFYSGEAMAANRATMMIDPWPPASGRRNIAYNGEKAARAAERYRTGRVIPPVSPTTSSSTYTGAPQETTNNSPSSSAPNSSGGGNAVK